MEQALEQSAIMAEEPSVDAGKWLKKIKKAETKLSKWRKEAKSYISSYEGGKDEEASNLSDFNILFSNTETLRSAVYNKPPTPRVVRRFKDKNDVAREVTEILERCISFVIDEEETDDIVKANVHTALLAGFTTTRVRYIPQMVQKPVIGLDGLPQMDEAGLPMTEDAIGFQEVELEDVDYDRLIWDCSKKWEENGWLAFEHRFSPEEMEKEFGLGKDEYQSSEFKGDSGEEPEKACKVYEVWDKETRQFFFIAEGKNEVLNLQEDPLGLDGFFPIPKPLQFVKTNGSSKPIPEFRIYKNQAEKLAKIAARKAKIITFIKATGVYDSSNKEIAQMLSGADGEMYPATLTAFENGMDVAKTFAMLPVDGFARVLNQLEMSIQESKQIIYEVTGISDIMRGSSVAAETATAQKIKGNFGTMRVQDRQKEVSRFVRDIVRLVGEVIAKHYTPETMQLMTGKPVGQQHIAMMRDDAVRAYTIDIEDDSTIQVDEEAEKQTAVELLTAVGSYMQTMGPLVEPNGMVPFPVAKELLMIAVRRFKGARSFEEVLDNWSPAQQAPQLPMVGEQNMNAAPMPQPNGSIPA